MSAKREIQPRGFTVGLALVDFLPVIIFSIMFAILAYRLHLVVFTMGTVLVAFAGLLKATWKLIVAMTGKNIVWMNLQMRTTMPLGFLLILSEIIAQSAVYRTLNIVFVFAHISLASWIFIVLGCVAMIAMSVFAFTLDKNDTQSNWIEQITNTCGQLCFLLAVICA
ncbi:hypothetical protein ACFQY8_05655 [Alloscardovia venturai]|uniref:Uncharacterized protein n=1 Tax=Alloscardovia venturai TaxID=1769421 RepID=A0ABW2Y636_9BIFI